MRHTIIDASQLELEEKSSLNQTCNKKLLKVDVPCVLQL